MDVVEAVAPLDAEPPLVCRSVAALNEENPIVLDMEPELAADAAIGAKAIDMAIAPVRRCAGIVKDRRGQRAPVGQAWTHSPQPTQLLCPMGSPRSKTIRW